MKNYKKVTLLFIKYGPSILALTCSAKILLLLQSYTYKDEFEYIVHWINWAFDCGILYVLYCAGRYFNYCWKHRSLCRITMWGYIYYALFVIFEVPRNEILAISIFYVIFVIIITICYKRL